ncbi:divalent metal cation transporter [Flavobacteriaceae bacterium F08102]|nr:divalent metal cation transporter [Flavobacteriaceae bacterium F08102]
MKVKTLKLLGPGLLFAGAAIGVSHLVQSTRAGADFGLGLLWAVILVNAFKYPFFQYGPRYAAATGESLIDGYKRLGNWVIISYFLLTFLTMFTIQAAVTIVTAGLATQLFGLTINVQTWSVIITCICLGILFIGRYKLLDVVIKLIIVTLTLSTVGAVIIALLNNEQAISFQQLIPKGTVEMSFLIAFLGWMPAPLDIATWHSLWTLEKQKNTREKLDTKQALFDFNVGFIGTFFLAVCFVLLGTLIMYHSDLSFSNSAGSFAQELINLYTEVLGSNAAIFIAIAAFTTMFSTTLTTLDASPRAMAKSTTLLFPKKIHGNYSAWLVCLAIGTMLILTYFKQNMLDMVKFATILSFLTAPFYAICNFILISGKYTPKKWHPSLGLKILSFLGIAFLIGFSIWYLFTFFE